MTVVASDIDEGILKSLPVRHPHLKRYLDSKSGAQLKLQQFNAIDMSCFENHSLEGINASSLLHEVFSYENGELGLKKFFQEAHRTLKNNGILVYRDPEYIKIRKNLLFFL